MPTAPGSGDASIFHCRCASGALPTLVGNSAVTCSVGCGWGSAGVETTAGLCQGSGWPAALCWLRGMLQEARGELGGAIINLPPSQWCTSMHLPSLSALRLPDSLRLARALSTSYFGTGKFLQDVFGPSFQFRAAGSPSWGLGMTPPSSPQCRRLTGVPCPSASQQKTSEHR